jgi:putative endonuclease
MSSSNSVGIIGEDIAASFLRKNGYIILGRNKRMPGGEIDIIARAPAGEFVFVEVKTLASEDAGQLSPEDEVSSAKLKKMRRAAGIYANANAKLIDEEHGWRIDAIAVVLTDPPTIRHYTNV